MSRKNYRTRTLVPWYHDPKSRCIAETKGRNQCKYSASHVAIGNPRILVCKIHADLLILLKGYKFRLVKPYRIDMDQDTGDDLMSVA